MDPEKTLAKQLEEQMSTLLKYEGGVVITYVRSGRILTENGKLERVEPKSCVELLKEEGWNVSIPFLGNSIAIQEITDKDGNVLYRNRLVRESYSIIDSAGVRKECGFE